MLKVKRIGFPIIYLLEREGFTLYALKETWFKPEVASLALQVP